MHQSWHQSVDSHHHKTPSMNTMNALAGFAPLPMASGSGTNTFQLTNSALAALAKNPLLSLNLSSLPTGTKTSVMKYQSAMATTMPQQVTQLQQQSRAINALTNTVSLAKKKTKAKKPKVSHNDGTCQCCNLTDKPFICDWFKCGKRFRQKPHLEAHRNIHLGKRFRCDVGNCDKSFVRKYNLVEHQKLHSAVSPNMCKYHQCGKVFSSRYSLMRHQTAQHNT